MADYAKLAQFDDAAGNVDYAKLATFEEPRSAGDRALGALPLASDFVEGHTRGVERGVNRMSDALSSMGSEGIGPMNAGKLALGGMEYVASPFEGAGTFLGNPIRRALGGLTEVGGVDPAEIAAGTAELAPMLAAPIPGAKTAEALSVGGGAIMGEAPAVASALRNAIPYIKSLFAGAPAIERAAESTAKSDILPGQVAKTSRVTSREGAPGWNEPNWAPQDWYEKQFRGGGNVPDVAPTPPPEPSTILGPKQKIGAEGKRYPVLKEDYQNASERPTLRTGHVPRVQPQQADEGYYAGAFSDEMSGANVPTDVPIGMGKDPRVADMYMPNIRENATLDPSLEQQIKDNYFRVRQTSQMREATGGGMPWAPTREPVGDPLDEMYQSYFNPGGGGQFPIGPRPNNPTVNRGGPNEPFQAGPPQTDASNDNLDNVYQGFFNKDMSPALNSPYRQAPMLNAEPMPGAPAPTPTPLPPSRMRGAQSVLDNPQPSAPSKFASAPEAAEAGGMSQPKTPTANKERITRDQLAQRPPMATPEEIQQMLRAPQPQEGQLPPVPRRTSAAKQPPAEAAPAVTKETAPTPAEIFGTHAVGDEVEIVKKIAGQEMRAPGGRIVELVSRNEPVLKSNKPGAATTSKSVSHEDVAYAKLEDGREIPLSMLQKFQPTEEAFNKFFPEGITPEGAADSALKKHMGAMSKAPAKAATPGGPNKNAVGTPQERNLKATQRANRNQREEMKATHAKQNKEENPSSMINTDDVVSEYDTLPGRLAIADKYYDQGMRFLEAHRVSKHYKEELDALKDKWEKAANSGEVDWSSNFDRELLQFRKRVRDSLKKGK